MVDSISALVRQHPILLSIFSKTRNNVQLLKSGETQEYVEVLPKEKFDSIFESFTLENKVWRFLMLEREEEEPHTLTVMFAIHHTLSDFVYNRQIMRSFVNNLCSIQLGKSPSIDIVYHPSDPIETVVDNIEIKSVGTEIKTCSSEKTVMAIDALCRSNSKQANLIWTENSSRTLRMKLDAELSKAFEASRSLCKGSLNATILTVCLKSFMRMLGSSLSQNEAVNIPFTFMVDLRRYIGKTLQYIGNASIDMLCYITLSSAESFNEQFWQIANNISQKIREIVQCGEPVRKIKEDAGQLYLKASEKEYPKEAIAFTHVGNIDDYLGDVTDIELVDIKPNVNVSFSLSSIFHVMTHVSKGEMHFCIAYDSNVTPIIRHKHLSMKLIKLYDKYVDDKLTDHQLALIYRFIGKINKTIILLTKN